MSSDTGRRTAAAGARTPTGRLSPPTARTAPTSRSAQPSSSARPSSSAQPSAPVRSNPARSNPARGNPARSAPSRSARATATRTAPGARPDDWDWRDVDARQHPQGRDRPPWRPVTLGAGSRPKNLSPSTRRMYQRRRRSMLLAFLLVSTIVLVVSQLAGPDHGEPDAAAPAPTVTLRPAAPTQAPSASVAQASGQPTAKAQTTGAATNVTKVPVAAGPQDNGFNYADGAGPVLGTAGTLRRFKVAVEEGKGQSAGDFAAAVERTLGDPRSWIAGKQFRLQRVSRTAGAEFTIFLASAATSERMCLKGGLHTDGFTSCRLTSQVIINLDRWKQSIPDYGAPLATYQAYAINHEVGHQLGHGHEACPAPGKVAPVMQQQTYGLKGCTANAWPYINGQRYAGSPVA